MSSSSPEKKSNPTTRKLVINLSRCRYQVIRDVAESLDFSIDPDIENNAQTVTKAIEQPTVMKKNTTSSSSSSAAVTASTTTTATGASQSTLLQNQARSNMSLLTVGSAHSKRPPVANDGVFAMIESRRAHIMWADVTVSAQQLTACAPWQRLNHFPGISQTVSRKVPLAHTMMRAWRQAPEIFGNIVPLSFGLKKDAVVLRQYFEELEFTKVQAMRLKRKQQQQQQQQQTKNDVVEDDSEVASITQKRQQQQQQQQQQQRVATSNNPFLSFGGEYSAERPRVFIFKPNAGCMGHDIKLTCRPLQLMHKLQSGNVTASKFLKEDEDFVVQVYIDRPLLIDKRKFDLRVYVLLMGVTPDLRILVHREGLVRICASEYAPPKASNVRKSTVHLTNYAVNKKKLGKTCDAAAKSSSCVQQEQEQSVVDDADDDDGDGESGDEGLDVDQEERVGRSDNDDDGGQKTAARLEIGGIKRDFTFLNSMLDSTFADSGGSAEIWRRIDRAMVLTLMAAHGELDRTYRQASTPSRVLLRRHALQFLKDQRKAQQQQQQVEDDAKKRAADNKRGTTQDGDDDNDDEDEEDDDDDDESTMSTSTGTPTSSTTTAPSTSSFATATTTTTTTTQPPSSSSASSSKKREDDDTTNDEQFVQDCCIGRNCFELLGFDLLLTETGHPYVMEVNHGPSLECGAAIDQRIKSKVLSDMLRHVSVFLPNTTKKPHLRNRRYMQRVLKKSPDADMVLKNHPTDGFRVAYPLVAPFANGEVEALAEEYRAAKQALLSQPAAATPVSSSSSSPQLATFVENNNNSSSSKKQQALSRTSSTASLPPPRVAAGCSKNSSSSRSSSYVNTGKRSSSRQPAVELHKNTTTATTSMTKVASVAKQQQSNKTVGATRWQ